MDGDGGLVVGDVVDGEANDAADGLGVEENERGGDPVSPYCSEWPPSTGKSAPVSTGRSRSDQGGDTERVACGIKEDPPPVGVRLEFGLNGPQSEQAVLSGVQVVDA
jgi:hypothetical protein